MGGEKIGGLSTLFKDAVTKKTDISGDGVRTGGFPTPSAEKETPGQIMTVSTIDVPSAPAPGEKVSIGAQVASTKGNKLAGF